MLGSVDDALGDTKTPVVAVAVRICWLKNSIILGDNSNLAVDRGGG